MINNHKEKIKISSIQLQGGNASPFFLNVDGSPGKSFTDIEIAGHDSIYIFIQVNVNPTNQNSPLIISDNIQFIVNGNTQNVYLEAWGQDAYYHHPTNAIKFIKGGYLPYSRISNATNTIVTWNNDKPHVIYGWLVVDSAQTLIINQGVRVYLHQNAGLWVYQCGTLKVHGTYGNEVVFQGDRFEKELADIPGQWDRIWINEGSLDNEIDHAIIKNGFIGIQAEILLDTNFYTKKRLKITNTRIQNMSKWGIYTMAFNVYGANNIISNCKEYCANITMGGKFTFLHCTFANYWDNDTRGVPCVHIDNHYENWALPMDSCYFGNCIVDGNIGSELELDFKNTMPDSCRFSYCVLKSGFTNDGKRYIGCRTVPTNFLDPGNYDFRLKSNSAAIDLGAGAFLDALKVPTDFTGFNRLTNPDAGAYEFQ